MMKPKMMAKMIAKLPPKSLQYITPGHGQVLPPAHPPIIYDDDDGERDEEETRNKLFQ